MNFDELFALPMPSRLREMADAYFKLLDADNYPVVPPEEITIRSTSLSKDDERCLGTKVAAAPINPKAGVFGFKVVEVEKERCRPVWACDINDYEFPCAPPPIKLHTSSHIASIMAAAEVFLAVDGKSMYDQFPLPVATRAYYVFRTHDQSLASLATLPAGFKHAPGIAQCTSEILGFSTIELNFVTCYIIIHLDNFGFAFTRRPGATDEQMWSDICKRLGEFFKRCALVGFQLNEVKQEDIRSFAHRSLPEQINLLRPLAPQQFTFLGVEYSLSPYGNVKTVAKKTLNKLSAVAAIACPSTNTVNPSLSYRQLAMVVGIIRHVSRILNIKHQDYNLYRSFNECSAKVSERPELWDTQIGTVEAVRLRSLGELIHKILAQHPIPVRRELKLEEAHTIIVDASKWGWGALHFKPNSTQFSVISRAWHSRDYGSSVTAEPQAALAVIRHLNLPKGTSIVVASDHSGLVDSSQAIQAHSYQYHRVLSEITPKWDVHFVFVPGKDNPADAPSRGLQMDTPAATCRALRAAAGAGAAWAYTFHESNPSVMVPTRAQGKDDFFNDMVT